MSDKNIMTFSQNQKLLHRPRMDNLLSKSIRHNLIRIVAGSGYGKTQAVSMFLNNTDYRVAWMQLSRLDNYPDRFWRRFLNALSVQKYNAPPGLKQLHLPTSLMAFDQFLHVFTEYIQKENQFVFVFDDFHSIYEKSVTDFIENLIAANIRNFCIILLSRSRINLPTHFQNRFTEADLCFTLAETDEYLKMQGIFLNESEVQNIQVYTEGWPLAVYLIGLNLKKKNTSLIDPLTGIKQIIFQLIEEEIFSKYSHADQYFMIKLSFLEEFPVALIQCLSNESIDTVKRILESNMFIQYNPYSEKYYLHNMFLSFLHKKQFYLDQQTIHTIYLNAAKWYHKSSLMIDAMSYYKKCGHYEEAWQILLNAPAMRRSKGTASLFIQFINDFPEEFIRENPMIRVIRASYMLNNLELNAAARDMLDLIEEYKALPDSTENQAIMGEAYILLAMIKHTQKEYCYVDYYKMAAACLPNGSIRNYRYTKIIDSNNAINPNSLDEKEVARFQKDLFEAITYASRIMNGFGYGVEYLASAEVAYFKGNLKKAQENAFEAIYRAKKEEQNDIICNAFFLLMKISSARGNFDMTFEYIEQLKEYASNDTSALSILDIAEGWFFIRIGHKEKVARWLLNDSLNFKTHPPISVGRDRLIRAYYFLKMEQYSELLAFSKQVDELYMEKGLLLDLVSIRLFTIISLYYLGDMPQCTAAFNSLYDVVNENHFIMQFVEMGQDMLNVINNVRKTSACTIPEKWLDNICAKASTYSKRQAFYAKRYNAESNSERTKTVRLTSREKEILDDLSQGLTRNEIAATHHISPNTVKSTLQNIYSKLGAVNSADAVRIAIEMNLIKF